jgi:hypothetical protein
MAGDIPDRLAVGDAILAEQLNRTPAWFEKHKPVPGPDLKPVFLPGGMSWAFTDKVKQALNRPQSEDAHPWNVKPTRNPAGQLVVMVNGRDGFGAAVNSADAQIGRVFCVPRKATDPVPFLTIPAEGGIYVKVSCSVEGTMAGYPQVEFHAGLDAPTSTETVGYLRVAWIFDYVAGVFRVVKDRRTAVAWRKCAFDSHVWGAEG